MSAISIENTLNAEALESNRIKDEFLTTLSHELRTPLSAILGWTRTLRSGRLDAARGAHGLEVIERNVVAQAKLIDDLLDVSRIITGKLRLSVRRASLASVIDAACEAMRPAADAKEIEIMVALGIPDGEDMIVGDPDRLQQVAWNLISNSIKFTPAKGRVTITLDRSESGFRIRVADTGRGIGPEFLEHVFERFRQADSSTARAQGGLGIGLAIARHLTELHGGSISAESEGENRGRLHDHPAGGRRRSRRHGEPAKDPARRRPPGPARGAGSDGHPRARRRGRAGRPGAHRGDPAPGRSGGRRGRIRRRSHGILKQRRPDVLLSDIGLPDEDGFSLIARVRKLPSERGGDVPALAVSAYVREEDRMRALAAGFQSYLAKPFDPSDLVAAVAALAGRTASAAAGTAPSPPRTDVAAAENAGSESEPDGAVSSRVLIVEDDRDSREGLRELLEVWGHNVEVAEDGAAGIEKAIATSPRIAIIDIGLPGLDGYEVAHRIRQAFGDRPIILIALTGYVSSEDSRRARESGFDAHLAKPINAEKLNSLLAGAASLPAWS
jgi:CheY-like chemotaxis protein